MNQQHHFIQQTHHGQHTSQTPQPLRHSVHASGYAVPFPNTPPLPTIHQPAYPAWSPQLHPSGSTSSMTQNVSPNAQASRGRDYLRSIGPAVSDLDQRFGALAVRNVPSDLNKPLPETPRHTQFGRPTQGPEGYIAASRPYATAPVAYGYRAPATASSSSYHASEQTRPNADAAHPVDRHRAYCTPPVNSHTHHITSLPTYTLPSSSFSPHTPDTLTGALRPSPNVIPPRHLRPPLSEPRLTRPYSDSTVPHTTPPRVKTESRKKGSAKAKRPKDPIYVADSDDGDTSSSSIEWVTNRSPARRRRAESERPASKISSPSAPLAPTRTNIPSPAAKTPTRHTKGEAVQCSGYTKEGQKCKRMVKAKAPYFDINSPAARAGDGDRFGERGEARYCKDHANLVIDQPGFSWMGTDVYIRYADYIPAHLGQQTQAVLRVTMESPFTAKESPGYLYAYELRDLRTASSSFFKVGRTDNPARRISEWTNRCKLHTPTLRDVFPLVKRSHNAGASGDETGLQRNPTLPTSYLLGAFRHSDNPDRCCPASKRWERLVHLELADIALQYAPAEYEGLKKRCEQCQAVHQEIFPLGTGGGVYEERVKEVICRWERFVRTICAHDER